MPWQNTNKLLYHKLSKIHIMTNVSVLDFHMNITCTMFSSYGLQCNITEYFIGQQKLFYTSFVKNDVVIYESLLFHIVVFNGLPSYTFWVENYTIWYTITTIKNIPWYTTEKNTI